MVAWAKMPQHGSHFAYLPYEKNPQFQQVPCWLSTNNLIHTWYLKEGLWQHNLLSYLSSLESSVEAEFLYIVGLMKGGYSRNSKAAIVVTPECEKSIIEEAV
jgi:hypothetical protein